MGEVERRRERKSSQVKAQITLEVSVPKRAAGRCSLIQARGSCLKVQALVITGFGLGSPGCHFPIGLIAFLLSPESR